MFSVEERRRYGEELYRALRKGCTLPPLSEAQPDIDLDDAYGISLAFLERRLQDGERVIGKKIGVTSKAVQDMLGVHQPDFGYLTDRMQFPNGAEIPLAGNLIQPRAEGEIAFRLKHRLKGPGITPDQVLAATEAVIPCFEIVDSRIQDWRIRIEDTVADNASCGIFVLGDQETDPRGLDLAACGIEVFKNGNFLSRGVGAAVQGSPLFSVAWLANTFGERGIALEAGEIVLSGSLVPLEPVVPGDQMHLVIGGVGEASVTFSEVK